MPLSSGTRIGRYEIRSMIGSGGMGEVYQAADSQLKRDVAIKVLGTDLIRDPDRLARFTREARILAGLNHNNIAHVYGVEETPSGAALVMELVTGRTLADALRAPGTLAMTDALAIARQIAEALEAAHDAGVVHRDLKPGNVMLRPDGVVKVLDFGLATTAADSVSADQDTATSPVLTARGVILGTAAYMSPEQAKGLPLDRRTDIWSFGVVLFELLSGGRRLFQGETVGEIAAAVIKDPIDFGRLPPDTPPHVSTLLARCLEREPRLRLRDIGEARVALSQVASGQATRPSDARAHSPWPWLALAGVLALVGVAAGWILKPASRSEGPSSLLTLPLGGDLQFPSFTGQVAVSPDGRSVAYSALGGSAASQTSVGSGQVFVRRLDEPDARQLADGTMPFWSPDGQWIGFVKEGRLYQVAPTGGPVSELGRAGGVNDRVFWTEDGTYLAGAYTDGSANVGVRRFGAADSKQEVLTTPDHKGGETHHFSPQLVAGGKAILYTVRSEGPKFRLDVKPLDGGPARTILADAAFGRYVGDGLLLFQRRTTLFVSQVDPETFEVRRSVPLVEDVAEGLYAPTWSFAAGTLSYRPREDASRTVLWVSRDGRVESAGVPPREFANPRISPDGRIAFQASEGTATNALVFGDGRLQQVTTDGQTRVPVWSADGRLFIQRRAANNDVFLVNTDGTGAEQVTKDGNSQGVAFPTPDGKWVVFHHLVDRSQTSYDLWIADLSGQTPPRPLIQTNDLEAGARLHPKGTWIAYATTRAGRHEIWIASFPDVTRKIFVSGDGSREPVWSRDGRELFFRNGTKMFAVAFEPGSGAIGQPKMLFDAPFFQSGGPGNTQYDVGTDGRFLMLRAPEHELPHWMIMQGWTAKMRAALAGK